MCGGIGSSNSADAEVQQIIESVKEQLISKTNQSIDFYTAVSYSTQVVAGTNFFVKVKIGDNKYIHMRIFRSLHPSEDLELHGIQENKTETDDLTYF